MKVFLCAILVSLMLVETGIGGENLNPLLVNQLPGTWLKLETKGDMRPRSIHDHAGVALDPENSVLHYFGSDTHNQDWNNDVWSLDVVSLMWTQSYEPDKRITYQFKDGCRSTRNGRPWCMHTFALNAWDPVGKRLLVSSQPIHYGLEELPQVTMPDNPKGCWWEYDPVEGLWTSITNGPELGLGHLCYVPTQKYFIAFNGRNEAVALYDPHVKLIEHLKFSDGPLPNGYTLKSAYDVKRDRILLISWNTESRLWAFDLKTMRWKDLKTANTPVSGIYGSWDYDAYADMIVSLWSENPEGGFSNKSGKSRTFLCDLENNIWIEHKTEPTAPYTGMSYKMVYDPRHKVTLYLAGLDLWSFKAPTH